MDTVKLAADLLRKPVFTIPTIASNCAPVTKLSIMYGEDGTFEKVKRLNSVPVHCFIHPGIILDAPYSLSQGRHRRCHGKTC
ncbi:MAG: iron-containing alcohol dehydrogenase [Enterocloster bolteae]